MSSIRHFTDEQFSDGTTIDGDRLEKALQDLEDYINNVPDGDFENRWLQSQIVLKYLPWTAQADAQLHTDGAPAGSYMPFPYMPVYNYTGAVTPDTMRNPFRLKGNRLDYQTPFTSNGRYGTHQVAWTTSFMTGEDPVIIDAVDAVFNSYTSEYVNTYAYGSSAPENRTNGDSVNDIHLQITVDSSFVPNIQIQNSVVYHKYNFEAQDYYVLGRGLPAVTSFSADMQPTLDTGDLASGKANQGIGFGTTVHIKDAGLEIPLPPFSRIRFSLVLPDAGTAGAATDPWGSKPWQTMIPTMTLSLLERLKNE
tara:strand:+ start:180 stop:1106 length:927 start_codon:yes stop_codon:yes gene_type:complete